MHVLLYLGVFFIISLYKHAEGAVSIPVGTLSSNNINAMNSMALSWGGSRGVVYFGQSFTNLRTLEMFSYYIAPDPVYNVYNRIYTSETFRAIVLEWDESRFVPIASLWTGSATLGYHAGYSSTIISNRQTGMSFQKVTANIGSPLALTPSKTYMLAFYFLAHSEDDIYALASTASGYGEAYSFQTRFLPSTAAWSEWSNEGTFIYEIVIGDCNLAPCQNGGTCIGPNLCKCTASYNGSVCQSPICTKPCQNSGLCIAPNTCSCTGGWQGSVCSQPVCSVSCKNGGTCSAPNTCTCTTGWSGGDCDTPICTNACIHGVCTGPNTCTCENNWQGPLCDDSGCDNLTTCGGRGNCTSVGSCSCSPGFDNSTNCGSCLIGYLNFPSCFSAALLPQVPTLLETYVGLFNLTLWWDTTGNVSSCMLEWLLNGEWHSLYQGSDWSYELSSLDPNTAYSFRISSQNDYGISDFLYFNQSTMEADVPDAPDKPVVLLYTRSTIDIQWHEPDNGSLPVLGYCVRMSNISAHSEYNISSLQFHAFDLESSVTYSFSVAAYNQIGYGNFSEPAVISTAPIMCGDGICDNSEVCASCFLDCGACGYRECPGTPACNSRGNCSKGLCECEGFWYGDACQYNDPLALVIVQNKSVIQTTFTFELPDTHKQHVNQKQHSSIKLNADQNSTTPQAQHSGVSFGIQFTFIKEIDSSGSTVSTYNLSLQSITLSTRYTSNSTTTIYSLTLPNKSNITIQSKVFYTPTQVNFANQSMQIPENGVKYKVLIENWPFMNIANHLMLSINANAAVISPNITQDQNANLTCSNQNQPNFTAYKDIGSENVRAVYLTVLGATLYGRFLENTYCDNFYSVRSVEYFYNSASDTIDIEIPHFWSFVELDPNFQVLFEPQENGPSEDCNTKPNEATRKHNITGEVVGGVVGALVGVAIILGVVYYRFNAKRRKTSLAKFGLF